VAAVRRRWRLLVPLALAAWVAACVRIPVSPSLPFGLYLLLPAADIYREGDLVVFCPSPQIARPLVEHGYALAGSCGSASALPFVKRVAALAGTPVCAYANGIRVGERVLPWPEVPEDLGLPRFAGCSPLPAGCLFVLGEEGGVSSIDSRIFGCVAEDAVQHRLVLLLPL
jgi:type IV secretory pathway protease TraF